MIHIDRKYLGFVSSKLDQFKQKNTDLYNFRCPYCGDSSKNKLKSRGYVYRKSNDYFFICHNCGKSTTFGKFLEYIDVTNYKQYCLERYSNGETGNHNYKKPNFDHLKGNAFARFAESKRKCKTWKDTQLQSVADLPAEHYAAAYIQKRLIPEKHWNEIFFTSNFKDFLDSEFPDHGKDDIPNDDRIVLFYTNENGEITNVAGRALSNTKIRYITVKLIDEKKVFGLHRLQKQNKVYILEGQFDSFFLENSIASGDSNLGGLAAVFPQLNTVLVYDNEPRNADLVRQIKKAIEPGHKVCLFPESVIGKDINEMIENGVTSDEIKSIIDNNTFSGPQARLEFTYWKRC